MAEKIGQIIFIIKLIMKVKYFVGFLAVMAFMASLQSGPSTVSHLTHLSGMVIGWFYLRAGWTSAGFSWRERVTRFQEEHRARKSALENLEEEHLHQQVDRILDKINADGYDSLTEEEQELLYRASARFSRKTPKN